LFNAVKTVLEQDKIVDKHLFAFGGGVIATEKDDSEQKKIFWAI
jgi:hypothetical protein